MIDQYKKIFAKFETLPLWFYIIVTLLLHILRAPEALFPPQFWAEDGTIFFNQDYSLGFAAFTKIYAGYLHLWPRLGAFVIGFAPLIYAPLFYKLATLLTHLLLLVFIISDRFPATRSQKILCLLATSLVPNGGEVFLNFTNTISTGTLILFTILILDSSANRLVRFYESVVLILFAITGPFILFLYPVCLIYLVLKKTEMRFKIEKIVSLTIGFIVQLKFFEISSRNTQILDLSIRDWFDAWINFFKPFIFANIPIKGFALDLMGLATSYYILFLFLKNCKKIKDWLKSPILLLLGGCFGVYAAVLFINRGSPDSISPFGGAQRYYYVPFVFLMWAIILETPEDIRWHNIRRAIIGFSFIFSLFYYHSLSSYPNSHWEEKVNEFKKNGTALFYAQPSADEWNFELKKESCWRCQLFK